MFSIPLAVVPSYEVEKLTKIYVHNYEPKYMKRNL